VIAAREYGFTADKRLVVSTHPDVATLAYPVGSEVPDELANDLANADEEIDLLKELAAEDANVAAADEAAAAAKAASTPANKQAATPANKGS
jgi:hypothetical protein